MAAPPTLPGWAVTAVRILLVAQGLIAAVVAVVSILLRIGTRFCYRDSFCELNDFVSGILALLTLEFAAVAIAGAYDGSLRIQLAFCEQWHVPFTSAMTSSMSRSR